ncbi:MAG: glycoside hydrolase family 76 protein, partial [Streptosporangiaceae bacterium]
AQKQHANFVNNFYDDNGWWALAWIEAYDLTRDSRYLQAAQTIFTANAAAWDPVCGGGLWWNSAKNYKNAIVNELFLTLAARLHQRTPNDQTYLNWALREWEWFSSSGLIGRSGMINDGLTAACANNGLPTWTYNQGVVLGGLAALYEITGDTAYLQQGEAIANATLANLTTPKTAKVPGILTEPCETVAAGCNGDQVQFKGIFARNLFDFYQQSHQSAYTTFLLANAASVWNNNKNAAHQFGMRWTGPFDKADAGRQSSALDALTVGAAITA